MYYIINLILPCVLNSVLTLLTFVLPAAAAEKITLGKNERNILGLRRCQALSRWGQTSVGMLINYTIIDFNNNMRKNSNRV